MMHYVAVGQDGPTGAAHRDAHRQAHRRYMAELDRQGRVVLAGPIKSPDGTRSVGVVVVIEAEDLAEARRVFAADPYVTGGVYDQFTVAPFQRVFPAA